ncbi:MAG TPA: YihY/virulence factor BrkB family protein [Terriglobia bacterium]|jgi:membrane protein
MCHFWGLLGTTFNEWLEDKAPRLGAAVAYYAAFSIAPLFVLFMEVMGFFYKGDTLQTVRAQISVMAGANAADAIVAILRGVQNAGGTRTATALSVITLLIAATGMFGQLQDAMNTIWEVTPKPRRFWWDILRTRLFSFLMIVAFSAVLLFSLALTTFLANVTRYFQTILPFTAGLWPLADLALSFVVTTALFAAIFKILPDVNIAWSDVWVGAAATAALFAIGKIGIGLYLGRSSFTSAYGAAGSLLALLAWVYFSSQILFFGAELTFVYAREYKHRFRPARGAVFLTEEMRIKQGIPHTETIDEAFKKKIA